MHYYRINIMPHHHPEYCFLRDFPEGVGLNRYRLTQGEAFGEEYPADPRVYMSPKEKGRALPSLVGNTRSMLIVHRDVKETIEANNRGPTEYLPLHIYDHRKRLASDEYFVVNPLGAWDCLDLDASVIEYLDGEVVGIETMVLDPEKLDSVPDLFRVREDPSIYLASQRLLERIVLGDLKPTNVYIDRLPVRGR